MRVMKEARKYIATYPDEPSAMLLARLILAMENESDFPITDLYRLDYERFELALKILKEWRLDRYYSGKVRLFDISLQAVNL